MATYLVLNSLVLILLGIFLRDGIKHLGKPKIVALLILLALTAVFDSLIITTDIVGYDETKISGLRIGYAPIEDFAYALAAGVALPVIWERLK
jgi:lycopene cyclase domain-containing protein